MNIPILSPQMRANVESILTPTILNDYLQVDGVSSNIKVTDIPTNNCYHLEVIFHNQIKDGTQYTDPKTGEKKDYFEFSPLRINGFRIRQNFTGEYLTYYEINTMLQVDQYQLLFYNYKDLRCTIILYAADVNTGAVYGLTEQGEPLLYIENAYCIFKNKVDIFKKNPRATLVPKEGEETLNHHEQFLDNISFQLIPEEDYIFRTVKCNTILTNSTISDAIWAIAKSTKCVDAIMMIQPDNTKKYDNLVIPPMLSISDALKFMQSYYGVYNKGLGFFFQRKTLFVYPEYETCPILPKDKTETNNWSSDGTQVTTRSISSTSTVRGEITLNTLGDGGMTHIYITGDNSYTGMQRYHGFENQTIHIVSNERCTFQDLADAGLENEAYGYIIHRTERDIDSYRTVLEASDPEKAKYGIWPINIHETPNTAYLAQDQQNTEIGITSTKANIAFSDDDIFAIKSRLYSYRRSLAIFSWNAAVPFTFRPGYRICLHYDGEDETSRDLGNKNGGNLRYTTKSGVVNAVDYAFTIAKNGGTKYNVYFCKADIVASLEVDKTKHLENIPKGI